MTKALEVERMKYDRENFPIYLQQENLEKHWMYNSASNIPNKEEATQEDTEEERWAENMMEAMGTEEQNFSLEKIVDGMLTANQFRGGITQKETWSHWR